jgi:hypothetical protein
MKLWGRGRCGSLLAQINLSRDPETTLCQSTPAHGTFSSMSLRRPYNTLFCSGLNCSLIRVASPRNSESLFFLTPALRATQISSCSTSRPEIGPCAFVHLFEGHPGGAGTPACTRERNREHFRHQPGQAFAGRSGIVRIAQPSLRDASFGNWRIPLSRGQLTLLMRPGF